MQFSEGKWGCVMWLAVSAAKGRPAVADRKTFGCVGGGVGLGNLESFALGEVPELGFTAGNSFL